jgi:hypothetical protein
MTERERLARVLADLQGLTWDAQSDASQEDLIDDARLILAAGYVRIPAEGTPEWEAMVERACMANINPASEPSDTERRHMRAALRAALQEKIT